MAEGSVFTPLYLHQRIQAARRAPIPTSTALDLARSNLTDDQIDEAASILGAPEVPEWGLSEMLDEWISRDPATLPVDDLKTLQTNLWAQGYVPPGTPIDGHWNPIYRSAFKRWTRDAFGATVTGERPGAASLGTLMRHLEYTLPGNVFSGIVGSAKGLVEQAPETAERLGVGGGIIAGAAIGAPFGGIGAGVGAVVGGVVAGVADFFGRDEEEEEQDTWHRFLDSLTPYDEYKDGGARALFEDLGFVLTAASFASGARLAAGGVQAIGAGVSAGAPTAKAGLGTPGVGAKVIAGALRGNVAAGGAIGAGTEFVGQTLTGEVDLSDIARAGAIGAGTSFLLGRTKRSAHMADKWLDFAARKGLSAQLTRPALKGARRIYTGASVSQEGARVFGGMLNPNVTTTIEKEIEEAPELPGATVIDWTLGTVLFPERLLPFRASSAAKAFSSVLGEARLEPWLLVMQKTKDANGRTKILSRGDARKEFFKLADSPAELGVVDQYHRLDAGIFDEAARIARTEMSPSANKLSTRLKFTRVRSALIRQIKAEGGDAKSKLAKELVDRTYADPTILTAHLEEIEGIGSGVQRWRGFDQSSRHLQDMQSDFEQGLLPSIHIEGKPQVTGLLDVAGLKMQDRIESLVAKSRTLRSEARSADAELSAAERTSRVDEAGSIMEEVKTLRKELRAKAPTKKAETRNFVVARTDYLTQQQLEGFSRRYNLLSKEFSDSFAAYGKEQNEATALALSESEQNLVGFLDDLEAREALPQEIVSKAKQPKQMKSVNNWLEQYASMQGSEIRGLPQKTVGQLASNGYKAVAVGEDIIKTNDLPRLLEITGVNDYSRREGFFAAIKGLGIDPRVRSDDALWRLRGASVQAELQDTLGQFGIEMKGRRAWNKINSFVQERNHPGRVRDESVASFSAISVRSRPGERSKIEALGLKVDPRELSVDDMVEALELETRVPDGLNPHEVGRAVYDAIHRGSAYGAEAKLRHPIASARQVGRVLGVQGLTGFSDWMRTWHVDPLQHTRFRDSKRALGTYGYLPQHLHRLNMALRYTLSPTFDLGRYVEQNMLGALKGVGRVIVRPKHFVTKQHWAKSPYRASGASGEEAWQDAVNFWDELNGSTHFQVADDIERRMIQKGIFGFTPRHHEAAQAWVLYQKGMKPNLIRERVLEIGRYGTGRSALEKTANFIFFPFSFQKKLLTAGHTWMFSAPARALLITEGLRRFEEFGHSDAFGQWAEKYFPLLDELKPLNNLAYGASPGRFFLEGIAENKSDLGKAMQAISSVFIPSGAATPLAVAAGGVGDRTLHAFTPVVVTGEKLDSFADIAEQFIPLVRDVADYAETFKAQAEVVTTGAEPYYQLTQFLDGKRDVSAKFDALAAATGYKDADSLLASDAGAALKPLFDKEVFALQEEFPKGWEMSRTFTEESSVKKKLLYDLANKEDRSPAEETIAVLGQIEEAGRDLARQTGASAAQVFPMVLSAVRQRATAMADDERFLELYRRFFEDDYGPLEKIRAA